MAVGSPRPHRTGPAAPTALCGRAELHGQVGLGDPLRSAGGDEPSPPQRHRHALQAAGDARVSVGGEAAAAPARSLPRRPRTLVPDAQDLRDDGAAGGSRVLHRPVRHLPRTHPQLQQEARDAAGQGPQPQPRRFDSHRRRCHLPAAVPHVQHPQVHRLPRPVCPLPDHHLRQGREAAGAAVGGQQHPHLPRRVLPLWRDQPLPGPPTPPSLRVR
mmetsp:Transcript_11210/g.25419  ORF Transcript_11210/g.25419 Transcript_11210/m.25419 type:complete len:215 (-) Transcript_11210:25-669(-)